MRMNSSLREENPKVVHHGGDIIHKPLKHEANIHLLYGSLVERYKRNQIALHLHLLGANDSPDTCIVCECGQVGTPCLEPLVEGVRHRTNRERTEFSEKQPPVLIDVCEFIQDSQARCVGLPVVVRLNRMNHGNCGGIDSLQTVSTLSTLKALRGETDREHILFVGCVFRNQNKLPNQVIEGGSQILETITNNEADLFRNRGLWLNSEHGLICGAACIWHELALVRVKIPLDLGFNEVKVKFCMTDFLSNAV